jgi:serine O-acetyltransferase
MSIERIPNNGQTAKLLIWSTQGVPKPIWRIIATLLGSDVACRLPKSTYLGHPYGIIIHSKARIGINATIMQNVTIGAKDESNSAPVIEDDVYIGANAVLLGNITIGSGAMIGAGAIVLKSIPSNAIAVGNPAHIVRFKSSNVQEPGESR